MFSRRCYCVVCFTCRYLASKQNHSLMTMIWKR